MHLSQHVEHFLAAAGEFAITLRFLEPFQRHRIFLVVNEPAAAVTAIVVDEERLIASRSRRQCREAIDWIGLIIVGTQFGVRLEVLAHCCLQGHACQHNQGTNRQ